MLNGPELIIGYREDNSLRVPRRDLRVLLSWRENGMSHEGSPAAEAMASDMSGTAATPRPPPIPPLAMPIIRTAGMATKKKKGSVITELPWWCVAYLNWAFTISMGVVWLAFGDKIPPCRVNSSSCNSVVASPEPDFLAWEYHPLGILTSIASPSDMIQHAGKIDAKRSCH
jgi:hypothetical protein